MTVFQRLEHVIGITETVGWFKSYHIASPRLASPRCHTHLGMSWLPGHLAGGIGACAGPLCSAVWGACSSQALGGASVTGSLINLITCFRMVEEYLERTHSSTIKLHAEHSHIGLEPGTYYCASLVKKNITMRKYFR